MRIRAGVVLKNNNTQKIALIKRIKPDDTYWIIPGGGIRLGESLESAARRELKEELKIQIDEIVFLGKINKKDSEENYFYATIEEDIDLKISGEERERQNINNLYIPHWIHKNQINSIKLYPKEIFPYLEKIW